MQNIIFAIRPYLKHSQASHHMQAQQKQIQLKWNNNPNSQHITDIHRHHHMQAWQKQIPGTRSKSNTLQLAMMEMEHNKRISTPLFLCSHLFCHDFNCLTLSIGWSNG